MDIIYCAGGGQKLAEIAIEEGFLYGSRSDDTRKLRCSGLVDVNWKSYHWDSHIKKISEHKPLYAVVPDILKKNDVKRALSQASEIRQLGVAPIVVPKIEGTLSKIPSDCIVGVSVPTTYAGFLPKVTELRGRRVHLLGGSPAQQRELYWYLTLMHVQVGSLDINAHSKASDFGSYWNGYKWYDGDRGWIGKYEAFRRSCQGIMLMWKEATKIL